MYDLIPPSMKAQFNLINKSNQSIKLSVNIYSKPTKKKNLSNYTYNKKIASELYDLKKKISQMGPRLNIKKHLENQPSVLI